MLRCAPAKEHRARPLRHARLHSNRRVLQVLIRIHRHGAARVAVAIVSDAVPQRRVLHPLRVQFDVFRDRECVRRGVCRAAAVRLRVPAGEAVSEALKAVGQHRHGVVMIVRAGRISYRARSAIAVIDDSVLVVILPLCVKRHVSGYRMHRSLRVRCAAAVRRSIPAGEVLVRRSREAVDHHRERRAIVIRARRVAHRARAAVRVVSHRILRFLLPLGVQRYILRQRQRAARRVCRAAPVRRGVPSCKVIVFFGVAISGHIDDGLVFAAQRCHRATARVGIKAHRIGVSVVVQVQHQSAVARDGAGGSADARVVVETGVAVFSRVCPVAHRPVQHLRIGICQRVADSAKVLQVMAHRVRLVRVFGVIEGDHVVRCVHRQLERLLPGIRRITRIASVVGGDHGVAGGHCLFIAERAVSSNVAHRVIDADERCIHEHDAVVLSAQRQALADLVGQVVLDHLGLRVHRGPHRLVHHFHRSCQIRARAVLKAHGIGDLVGGHPFSHQRHISVNFTVEHEPRVFALQIPVSEYVPGFLGISGFRRVTTLGDQLLCHRAAALRIERYRVHLRRPFGIEYQVVRRHRAEHVRASKAALVAEPPAEHVARRTVCRRADG